MVHYLLLSPILYVEMSCWSTLGAMLFLHSAQTTQEFGFCIVPSNFLPLIVSHCHIDWHLVAGMAATFIEAPLAIQKRLVVPEMISQQCLAQGIPVSGYNSMI